MGAGALPGLREGFGEGVNGHVPQNPAQSEKMGMGKEGYEEVRGNKTRTFRMAFPEKAGPRPCPVEGCSVQAETRTYMRMHLWNRHVRKTVVIL